MDRWGIPFLYVSKRIQLVRGDMMTKDNLNDEIKVSIQFSIICSDKESVILRLPNLDGRNTYQKIDNPILTAMINQIGCQLSAKNSNLRLTISKTSD